LEFGRNSSLGHKLSSAPAAGEGSIIVSDATTWLLTIPEQFLPLAVGEWLWFFKTVDADGDPRTLLKGTIKITSGTGQWSA
jgi:hypothetical protein